MIALEELISGVRREIAQSIAPAAIIVGRSDCDRIADQLPLYRDRTLTTQFPNGALAKLHGVWVFEDAGLPPGNYEFVKTESALRMRLHLIRLGLTVTPDGMIKPADWWEHT